MPIDLYKPNEYPVIVGNERSTAALCTLWQDPARVAAAAVRERFAIVGQLRSPFGLNLMLYNLARNPQIRELVIWGPDKLSNTDIGLVGKRALLELWTRGVDEQGRVGGSGYALVPEIDPAVVRCIVGNVRLQDLSGHGSVPLAAADGAAEPPYMEAVRFPEFVVAAPSTWPSEEVAFLIRERTGAEAYLQLLDRIWRYGIETPIDTDGEAVKELRDTIVVVEGEDLEQIALPEWLVGIAELEISRERLENYRRTQFSPDPYRREIYPGVFKFERPPDYSYLYAELLYAFPRPAEVEAAARLLLSEAGYEAARRFLIRSSPLDDSTIQRVVAEVEAGGLEPPQAVAVLLEALLPPLDQVANVVDRVRRKPDDLDKEVVLWDPRFHSTLESGRPCLMKLSFSLRKGKLDVLAFFRSHDILGAWFFNYYGIAGLLRDIARRAGCAPGRIVVESESAHIYQRHWSTVCDLLEAERQKKPPRMAFDPDLDADPRGNAVIAVADGAIKLKLLSPAGDQVLLELEGRTAHELLYRLKHLSPLSRVDHGIFLGSELGKAEAALRLGLTYQQDRPLSPTTE